ncbi:class I SAM-dependent methyltransferase [bacterium]|nr:class I SAM-dependent methyltransferase [bacterium]
MIVNSKERFSNRVENYIKYRPGYPGEVIRTLTTNFQMTQSSVIADVGSGTGILSELFLRNGNQVFGIEPNEAMRHAGEALLSGFSHFKSVIGTAEATTLPAASIDFVVAGQAFHWFEPIQTRREFLRILKPSGCVVLIWNDRKIDASPFLSAFEEFVITYSVDYKKVDHKNVDQKKIRAFFEHDCFEKFVFKNSQSLDLDGLQGRVLSASYMPMHGHPDYPAMVGGLHRLFERFECGGQVRIDYETLVYAGQLHNERI